MAYDLRSRHGNATVPGGQGSEASMVPGKRSLTAMLYAANWFVKGDATTRAHEIGHLLG
jgi:hypothetical protein